MALNSHLDGKQVRLKCTKELVNIKEVPAFDIETAGRGGQFATFTCPKCNETHRSLIFGF